MLGLYVGQDVGDGSTVTTTMSGVHSKYKSEEMFVMSHICLLGCIIAQSSNVKLFSLKTFFPL